MKIKVCEQTYIPQTWEGREFANEYEKKLKEQGVLQSRSDDTQTIKIEAVYTYSIKETEDK